MSFTNNLILAKEIMNYLPEKEKKEIYKSICLTFFVNLIEILNIFLASAFAFLLTGTTLESSKKLGFIADMIGLKSLDNAFQFKLVAFIFAIFSLLLSIFTIISLKNRANVSAKVTLYFTETIIQYIFNTNYRYFKNLRIEKLINSIFLESNNLNSFVIRPLLEQINVVLLLILFFIFWLYYAPLLAIAFLIFSYLLYLLFTQTYSKILKSFGRRSVLKAEGLTGKLIEIANLYREYLLSGLIKNKINSSSILNRKYRYLDASISYIKVSPSIFLQGLVISIFVISLSLTLSDEGINSAQLSSVAGILYSIQRLLPSIQKLLRSTAGINAGYPSYKQLLEKLNLYKNNQILFNLNAKTSYSRDKTKFLEVLNFKLPNNDKFQDKKISFSLLEKGCFGIKGRSGIGKTTILDFLSCMYLVPKEEGEIFINGINLFNSGEAYIFSWMTNIAYVPQNPYLINGSLEENIKLLSPVKENKAKMNQIIEMKWMKDITTTLNFNKKNELKIEVNGSNLSGGQIQRIALARALYMDTKILLLDEITSALDKKNESYVLETLKYEKEKRSIVLVSHKEKPLSICDNILDLSSN